MKSFNKIVSVMLLLLFVIILVSCNDSEFKHYQKQEISKVYDLGDGGSVTASITVDAYDGADGNKYLELLQISYYIIFSPEFKNVEISYCDGENTYKESSDQLNEVYEIDANKVLYEDNKIKAIFDIYLENGEKQTIELP